MFIIKKIIFYYSIRDLIDAIKSYFNLRYLFFNQRFFGKYTLRNRKNIYIGKNVKFYHNFFAEAHNKGKIIIEDGCVFNRNIYLTSFMEIKIGKNSLFGPNVFIGDHDHGSYEGNIHSNPNEKPIMRGIYPEKISIGDNVWVGNNVTITKGSQIGEGSVIGANSVVKGYIPPFSLAVGSPAKVKKRFSNKQEKWVKVSKND